MVARGYLRLFIAVLLGTVKVSNTGRVINFKVILIIIRKGFCEFFFHKKVNELWYFSYQYHFGWF